MANLAQVEAAFLKADEVGDVEAATALASEIRRLRQESQKVGAGSTAEERKEGRSAVQIAGDVAAGMTAIPRGVLNLLSGEAKLGNRLMPQDYVDKESIAYTIGQVLDPTSWALGGAAMKGAQMLPKLGPVAQGMLGGAVGGGAIGGLTDEGSVASGATIGGLVGGALPAGAKFVGRVSDIFSGTQPALRAQKILKEVAGDRLPQIRQLWQQAPDDITAAQAAAPAESTTLSALGERAARMQSQPFRDIAARQEAARKGVVAGVAGGETQTSALGRQSEELAELNKFTTPLRETELGAANTARKYIKDFADRIGQKGESLVKALQDQWRLTTDEAQAMVRFAEGKPGWISNADYASQAREAADIFSKVRGQRLVEKDFIDYQLRSLSAYGLKPIDTDAIIASIGKRLDSPSLAGNSIAENAMKNVSNEISQWTAKGGGIIDAEALYAIRKNAVNSAVQKQLAGSSPKAQQKVAAGVLNKINPLIDEAIERAGGTGWKNYLNTHAEGMKVIDEMRLGAKALKMLEGDPKGFIALVEGNKPEVIKKMFGKQGVSDVAGQSMSKLSSVADELKRDLQVSELAKAGADELSAILRKDASRWRLPNLVNRYATTTNYVIDAAEEVLNRKTADKLYTAMQSGAKAEELMKILPAKERVKILKYIYDNNVTPYAAGGIAAGAQ